MEAELVMDNNPHTWERGLEGLIAINEDQLSGSLLGGFLPPLYQSGVVYRPEKNSEKWKTLKQVYQDGMGDCEDLAAVRCAELRTSGEDPLCVAHIYQTGPRRWHATVLRSNGWVEDPTKILKALEKQRKNTNSGESEDNMSGENQVLGQWGQEYAPYGYGAAENIDPYNTGWADAAQWAQYGGFDAGGNWTSAGMPYQSYGGFGGYPTGYEYGGYGAYGGYPGAYDYGYGAYGQYPPGYGGGYDGYGGYGAYGGYQDPYGQDPYAQAEQMYNEAVVEAQQELDTQKARMRKRRELQQANRQRRQARLQEQRRKRQERAQAQRERQRARREAQRQRRIEQQRQQQERRNRRVQWEAQAAQERRAARPRGWHL